MAVWHSWAVEQATPCLDVVDVLRLWFIYDVQCDVTIRNMSCVSDDVKSLLFKNIISI